MAIHLIAICLLIVIGFQAYRRFFSRSDYGNGPSSSAEEIVHIVCVFSMFAKVATADGEVSQAEKDRIKRYAEEKLKLPPRQTKVALQVFEEAINSPLSLKDYAERFKKEAKERVLIVEDVVRALLELASADSGISLKEENAIKSGALHLGLSEQNYDRIKKTISPPEHFHQ